MNRLDLVVGPNGAGKSTFVELTLAPLLAAASSSTLTRPRSNAGRTSQRPHAYQAAGIVAKSRAKLIELGKSFIAETVSSHPSQLDLTNTAQTAGHSVVLHVVLLPEELAVLRVRHRIDPGGHDVPEDKIRRRYQRLWDLIAAASALADSTMFYDNSAVRGTPDRRSAQRRLP